MNNKLLIAAGFIAASALSNSAIAQTADDTMTVTAVIEDNCAVVAADLDFGTYTPTLPVDLIGATTVDVSCSLGLPFTLAFNTGGSGSFAQRSMTGGATSQQLDYQLCSDPLCLTILGDGSGATGTLVGLGVGLVPVIFPVSGVITANQDKPTDTYTDTITVTASF